MLYSCWPCVIGWLFPMLYRFPSKPMATVIWLALHLFQHKVGSSWALGVALCHLHSSLNSMRKTGRSPCLPFYVKHICHMQSLEIQISLLARVSGWFTDQRIVFHLRINGFISAFPAISSNVYIIRSTLATQVSPSLHLSPFLTSSLHLQLCSAISQGCHKNIIIKYLVVSWVLSSKATWLNMRSFFPDPNVCPPPPLWLIYSSAVLGGCGWESDDMLCVFLLSLPSLLLSTSLSCRFICKRYGEW